MMYHISILMKSLDESVSVIMVYSTHTFFYIVCFTIWVNAFKENCCCFITTACLSCKLITQLVTNRAPYFCVWFHFSLLCCNTFVLNNILFKIFIDELLNFRVIWHIQLIHIKNILLHVALRDTLTKAYKVAKCTFVYIMWYTLCYTHKSLQSCKLS